MCFREIGLSAAEKQRQYRARRDADPERRTAYLQKHREKWHDDRKLENVKTMKDLSEREKRRKRAYWRRAQRQSRERKKVIENQVSPPQSPEDDPQPQMSRYRFIEQIIGSTIGIFVFFCIVQHILLRNLNEKTRISAYHSLVGIEHTIIMSTRS